LQVTIDPHSGFCFGVVSAISAAERELKNNPELYCLGDIVHNNKEVNRLADLGLKIINHEEFGKLHDCRVLIRAHGEPPATYRIAEENHIELIDASCPIVLRLQHVIHKGHLEMKAVNGQIVIYGKAGHAEVNGLNGQTDGTAIIIAGEEDLDSVDFSRPVRLYSQTTMSVEGFAQMVEIIKNRMEAASAGKPIDFKWKDSVCRQVSNRAIFLEEFAARNDVVIFVAGKSSSNGKVLYDICKEVNARTYLASDSDDLRNEWFSHAQSVGICGATSTPRWLMEEIGQKIREINP